jgi:4-hydroxy-tetrahydrodipicolinate synthase
MTKFIGTGVALITPFKKTGEVDTSALANIVDYVIAGGVEYLVVLGTTAESATLSAEEKELVKNTIIIANNSRVPLVLGVGANDTSKVVAELKTTNLDHFDAILSVSPYYNKPSQEGIYLHFKAIAEATETPIILYNVPGRTASNMSPETVVKLARDFDNIIAIKEAAGDLVQAMKILQHKPEDFLVISGDDMIALPMTLAGGAGVISVIGEGFPREFSEMIRLGIKGSVQEAYALHYQVADAIDYIFEEGNPAGIKAVFKTLDLCELTVRLPLVAASETLQKKLRDVVDTMS